MRSRLSLLLAIMLSIVAVDGQFGRLSFNNVIAQTKIVSSRVAPVIKANTLDGKEVSISYGTDRKHTVLYVFSPSCSWCRRNWDNAKTLAKDASKTSRFFGLALNANNLQEHINSNQVNFPVYKDLSSSAISGLELGSAPQTIVISPSGKVIKNWIGAYSGDIQREIEKFFGVKLPGVNVQSQSDPQYCAYCIWNGLLNSPGAVVEVDGKKIRCKQNGRWTSPY